jgi:hypothetical protein
MFANERRAAIKQRAKLMGRMVMLLTDGLCTKSYDQFVERFSNPGDEPDETARIARISRFAMRFSPTCWYQATASLYENGSACQQVEIARSFCLPQRSWSPARVLAWLKAVAVQAEQEAQAEQAEEPAALAAEPPFLPVRRQLLQPRHRSSIHRIRVPCRNRAPRP